jgi:NAD+ synthase (glutamine-hydrolysing)
MHQVGLGVAAVNQTPLCWEGNRNRIIASIDAAKREGVAVLCFPELCVSGYGLEDAFFQPEVVRRSWESALAIAGHTKGMVVGIGLPVAHKSALYNGFLVLADGLPLGVVAKRYLAGDGVHYESRWFKPWPQGVRATLSESYLPREWTGIPIGDLDFCVNSIRIAVEICEDAWSLARPITSCARQGIDLVFNPSASHFARGKLSVRRQILFEGARLSGAVILYANLLGCESGKIIFDGDSRIVCDNQTMAETERFSFRDFELATALAPSLESRRTKQRAIHSLAVDPMDSKLTVYSDFNLGEHQVGNLSESLPRAPTAAWEDSEYVWFEEFWRAVALGLFDYARKTRSRGFVVSLSGGADSSCVASLVGLMARRGVGVFGPEDFARRLSLTAGTLPEVLYKVLHCIYQKTANSSEATEESASSLARDIGCRYTVLDIQPIVTAYQDLVEHAIGRSLTWESDDVALQNIQARVRSPSVWMFANISGALLLTTGNRSELSVGYATMDGDMSGGLNPIGGIDKCFIREFLVWLQTVGPHKGEVISGLFAVNHLQPSAELRPPTMDQRDEKDLMPYEILQSIEQAFVQDKLDIKDIFNVLTTRFEKLYSHQQLLLWLKRYFNLFARNQWKRERGAPAFHVDTYSLDPRSWYRFPIISSGFEEELSELEEV